MYVSKYGYTKQEMSPDLARFFRELSAWIDGGMPENDIFVDCPICFQLTLWAIPGKQSQALRIEFTRMRRALFPGSCAFPFHKNEIGPNFMDNPARVDFIHTMGKN